LRGILVSDRATALSFWAMDRRQICWAHLLRKFVAFAERAGPSAEFGRQLLDYTGLLFDYWHDYKAGKLDRATFRAWMAPVRAQVETVLKRAVASDIDHLAGSCANILEHRVALSQKAPPAAAWINPSPWTRSRARLTTNASEVPFHKLVNWLSQNR
jgi:transposase